MPATAIQRAVTGHLSLIPYTGQRCRERSVWVAVILASLTPAIRMQWVGVRDVAVRPRWDGSLSYYTSWLRRGWLRPSPLWREGTGRSAHIRSQLHVRVPPLSPCSSTGKGGEEVSKFYETTYIFRCKIKNCYGNIEKLNGFWEKHWINMQKSFIFVISFFYIFAELFRVQFPITSLNMCFF